MATKKHRMSAGRTVRAVESKVWRVEALKLRTARLSMREIATKLGKSVGAVHKAITEELKNIPAEAVDELRKAHGESLDAEFVRLDADYEQLQALIGKLMPKGKKLLMGGTADVIIKAFAQRTSVTAQRTSILAQRAKLFGLNAKESLDITGELALTHGAEDDLLDRLARFTAEAGAGEVSKQPEPSGEAGPSA